MRDFISFLVRRVKRDELFLEAAALSFTTILALIPALTVIVSIFTMAPAFEPLKESLLTFARDNFMPVFTDAVTENVGQFVEHAGSMTATGSIVLIVVSLLLVRAVDKTLNRIWRGGKRRFAMTVAIYWTMLTMGPLAVSVLLWMTSRIITLSIFGTDLNFAQQFLYFIMPVLIEIGVVTVLFLAVPVASVKMRDALLGAFLVTLLFELAKRIFAAFILNFSDYQAIYGALAALPVLMIWININWFIILLGAEFTALLGTVRSGAGGVPLLFVRLAELTGSTFGSDHIKQVRPKIRIKVSNKPYEVQEPDPVPTPGRGSQARSGSTSVPPGSSLFRERS